MSNQQSTGSSAEGSQHGEGALAAGVQGIGSIVSSPYKVAQTTSRSF